MLMYGTHCTAVTTMTSPSMYVCLTWIGHLIARELIIIYVMRDVSLQLFGGCKHDFDSINDNCLSIACIAQCVRSAANMAALPLPTNFACAPATLSQWHAHCVKQASRPCLYMPKVLHGLAAVCGLAVASQLSACGRLPASAPGRRPWQTLHATQTHHNSACEAVPMPRCPLLARYARAVWGFQGSKFYAQHLGKYCTETWPIRSGHTVSAILALIF